MNALGYPLWVVPLTPTVRVSRPRLAIGFSSDGFGHYEWLLDNGKTIEMTNVSTHLDEQDAKQAYDDRRKNVLDATKEVEVPA